MNTIEVVDLIDRVQALWPDRLKALPDVAPLAWQDALDDISHADAREALSRMARRDEWFALNKLVSEVKRLRSERIEACGITAGDVNEITGDNPRHWHQELRELHQRAADGRIDRDWYEDYLAAGKPVTEAPRALQAPPGASPANTIDRTA